MQNDHVADARHPGKSALLQWLSTAAPVVLRRAPSINYRLVAPILATALIASAALLACGSENASSSTDDDQPPVASTVQVQPANDGAARTSGQATLTSGDSATSSRATAAPKPTATDEPTIKPKATATPEPTPTPTVVPWPTPDIKVEMSYIMLGEGDSHLRRQNIELIKEAVAPYVVEFALEEYPDLSYYFGMEGSKERMPDNLWIVELKQIPSDGEDLHVKVTMEYEQRDTSGVRYLHDISVDVAIKAATPPYDNIALPIPGHRFEQELQETLDRMEYAPVFSHLLNDPVISPGSEQ